MASIKLNEKLCAAVQSESLVDVRLLLGQGADPLEFTSNGMNAVGVAASNGNTGILARLLEHCHQDQDGPSRTTVIYDGGSSNHPPWMEVDEGTPEGMGELEWDEEIDQQKVFSPDKEWLNLYSYYARMWENIGQVLDVARELKDVHCLDRHQMAPLHYAAKFGHLNCVRLLIGDYKSPVDVQTYSGQTALHLACEYQHAKIVKFLLQSGASVNLKTFKVEDTALLKAAKNGNNRIVQLLLDHGANINTCNAYDVSPLIGATFFGHQETVKLLVQRGANVNLKDRDGLTALVIAVHNEATEAIRCLLENGARVIPTHNLVHTAVNLNNDEILRMLIMAGESVTRSKDSYGLTPMDKLIQRGNVEMLLFCYRHFRLREDPSVHGHDPNRELLMAIHCDDVWAFRRMLRFFLNLGRSLQENDLLVTGIKLRRYEQVQVLIQENVDVNTEWNEEVLEMLKRDNDQNVHMLMVLVAAGFAIHQMSALRDRWMARSNGGGVVGQYLHRALTNPRSLQDLTRIRIRKLLRDSGNEKRFRHAGAGTEPVEAENRTPFEKMLWSCGLPPRLVQYVYEFPDLIGLTTSAIMWRSGR